MGGALAMTSDQFDVVVVGSLNMDLTFRVQKMPGPGETAVATDLAAYAGGAGANQAVAAARLGARVAVVGRVGRDPEGQSLARALLDAGVDISCLQYTEGEMTGRAAIWVDAAGERRIVTAPGANRLLSAADVNQAAPVIQRARVVLVAAAAPEAEACALTMARAAGVLAVVNPVPLPRPLQDLATAGVVVLNEAEAADLTGHSPMDLDGLVRAATALLKAGMGAAVITRGAQGCYLATRERAYSLPAYRVQALDTTGAGDAFCGALAAALARGWELPRACRYASAAAALAVTRPGGLPSMPYREEVDRLVASP